MSDEAVIEVGPYEAGPTYRVPRRRLLDDGTRRLAIIAGGLGAALLAVVGVWSLSGSRPAARIPVIEADSRPVRVKPENPGGMQLAGSNDEILSGDISPQNGKLAPAPEMPKPEALRQAAAPKAAAAAAPVGAPPAALANAPALPVPPTPKAVPAAKPEASASPARVAQLPLGVQLGALDSESDAKAEWSRLSRKMPDVLRGHSPAVMKAELDGRTVWRLRTGGFADPGQATAFCERVRAKGAGCSVASF